MAHSIQTANVQVDLSQAVTGTWSANNTANAGKGIYDPVKWAVVFKYSSVNIPAGVTVTFKNHPSGAPVVWLVQENAAIAGTVNLDGKTGEFLGVSTEAGPGGFMGGAGLTSVHPIGSGFGPGGGPANPRAVGSSALAARMVRRRGPAAFVACPAPTYGNSEILPLIGGSGGTGRSDNAASGGGGGGAIQLCAGGTVNVTGTISAVGGSGTNNWPGGGSGGAIRILADTVSGGGNLYAYGGSGSGAGGAGRIRLECNSLVYIGSASPAPSYLNPFLNSPEIWPASNAPTVTIASIGAGRRSSRPVHRRDGARTLRFGGSSSICAVHCAAERRQRTPDMDCGPSGSTGFRKGLHRRGNQRER